MVFAHSLHDEIIEIDPQRLGDAGEHLDRPGLPASLDLGQVASRDARCLGEISDDHAAILSKGSDATVCDEERVDKVRWPSLLASVDTRKDPVGEDAVDKVMEVLFGHQDISLPINLGRSDVGHQSRAFRLSRDPRSGFHEIILINIARSINPKVLI